MQMNNWLEKQENIDNEATHCPAEVEPGVTDTAVPFFIILGILATFVLMIILSLRVFQLGKNLSFLEVYIIMNNVVRFFLFLSLLLFFYDFFVTSLRASFWEGCRIQIDGRESTKWSRIK
jgi:hypothetical protein